MSDSSKDREDDMGRKGACLIDRKRTLGVVDVETNMIRVAFVALERDLHGFGLGERKEVRIVAVELV